MLELINVWKRYQQQVVLERLNVSVREGEFVTLVGASGCGKTTFLRLLLGTESASQGQVLLDGQPIPQQPGEDRGIVFQRYSVFPHLTVLSNVMIGREFAASPRLGKLFGSSRRSACREALSMLEEVGLADAANKYPHQLSGGMQQRLALAQALIKKPRILLLDEPFGALDPGIRQDMHNLLNRLWRSYELTVFMTTHDLSEGFTLGSRLWVFDKTRRDPGAPEAYGACITYDIPLDKEGAGPIEAIVADKVVAA